MKPVALLGYEGIRELPDVAMQLRSLSSSRSMSINRSRKTDNKSHRKEAPVHLDHPCTSSFTQRQGAKFKPTNNAYRIL